MQRTFATARSVLQLIRIMSAESGESLDVIFRGKALDELRDAARELNVNEATILAHALRILRTAMPHLLEEDTTVEMVVSTPSYADPGYRAAIGLLLGHDVTRAEVARYLVEPPEPAEQEVTGVGERIITLVTVQDADDEPVSEPEQGGS